MNKWILAFFLAAPVMAQVDYSRCNVGLDPSISPSGEINFSNPPTNVRTEGLITSYTVNYPAIPAMGQFPATPAGSYKVVVTRDEQNRIASVRHEYPAPTSRQITEQRRQLARSAAAMMVPGASNKVWVRSQGTLPMQQATGPFGLVERDIDSLNVQELRELGVTDITPQQLRSMRGEWRRDARTLRRLESIYENLYRNYPVSKHAGSETRFEHRDGACLVARQSFSNHSSLSPTPLESITFDSAFCAEVNRVHARHASQLQQCARFEYNLMTDYMQLQDSNPAFAHFRAASGTGMPELPSVSRPGNTGMGGLVGGGFAGGYPGGGIVGGGMMGGGMYGGGMMGGGYGMGMGSPSQQISMQHQMCQYYSQSAPAPEGRGPEGTNGGAAVQE